MNKHYAKHRRNGRPALGAISLARADIAAGKPEPWESRIWKKPASNQSFNWHGETMLWIENPAAVGLRFCGLAHDLTRLDHTGWFMSEDGWTGETCCGVVYQLPARNGLTRFLAGYADPYQSAKDGSGPACLSLEAIESETHAAESDCGTEDAMRQAARNADWCAEKRAEESREHDSAWRAGGVARDMAREAYEAGLVWLKSFRQIQVVFNERWQAQRQDSVPIELTREWFRQAVRSCRDHRESYVSLRESARDYRNENRPFAYDLRLTFVEAYENQ